MKLRVIAQHEDKANPDFASAGCQQVLLMYEEYYPKTGFELPWVAYWTSRNEQITGCCSFVNKPSDNMVEIAYWTFKEYEGQGIATEACRELVKIALEANPAVDIIAKTEPQLNASTKILERNNFTFTGIVQDDDIGDAWLWTYNKSTFLTS